MIQLYAFPTPNGVKASIALEEMGLPYEPHRVTLSDDDVRSSEFLSINPNNKIPALLDPDGPGGEPLGLFESGAILIYLAEKTGALGGSGADAYRVRQWLMWQMGGLGPMFGQLGYFHKFAGSEIEDPRPRQRYVDEAKRAPRRARRAPGGARMGRRGVLHRRHRHRALAASARLLRGPRRSWAGTITPTWWPISTASSIGPR